MAGINQLPGGSEYAAAISLIWATTSWFCSAMLLWLTWSHHEGFSYLALLSMSALFSNTFSMVQQGRDITWYQDVVIEQFKRKQTLPGDDPELAIAGGSLGVDLVLYYLQYYSYNVQAMLVMFWAAELCQLTYQVGERRKIRRLFRKLHYAGKFISWLFPLVTISSLQTPGLKDNFVAFILIADLPLMLSLAIGSGLMVAVTIRYMQSRKKFTQWSPPNYNSATSGSEAGTAGNNYAGGTQSSSRAMTNKSGGMRGLYDRWLMVRFTIAFVLLAIFEVTNTLFQVTALNNNMHDSKAAAPDLSTSRAVQTLFLYMPGTTPGIFMYIVFGTTAASRQKVAAAFSRALPHSLLCCLHRGPTAQGTLLPTTSTHTNANGTAQPSNGKITIERSLTITSTNRSHPQGKLADEDDFSDPTDIWMSDIPLDSNRMKPLPLAPRGAPVVVTTTSFGPARSPVDFTADPRARRLRGGGDEYCGASTLDGGSLSRPTTSDSLRVPGDDGRMDPEHSDDSGPILPIQRHEVRFSADVLDPATSRFAGSRVRQSKNFSLPRR